MVYFNSRDIAAIALLSSLWGVLSSVFSPIVFSMFNLPILCDMIGFAVLSLTVWWIRKIGAATLVGLVATVINFIFNPAGLFFLGFTAASIVFDMLAWLARYNVYLKRPSLTAIVLFFTSVLSAAVAGLVIGTYFMAAPALTSWGGVIGWVMLHAVGGTVGGIIGVLLVMGLVVRGLPKIYGNR
ncbi:MAG TPA: hypothetical protein VEH86_03450 [Candidatus Acidoferrum sp.]|nr:hypothetical protein [Candidatus Acidoferrum sp.]